VTIEEVVRTILLEDHADVVRESVRLASRTTRPSLPIPIRGQNRQDG
jgi:hypothetical protein